MESPIPATLNGRGGAAEAAGAAASNAATKPSRRNLRISIFTPSLA
jgi:hypothetical protein